MSAVKDVEIRKTRLTAYSTEILNEAERIVDTNPLRFLYDIDNFINKSPNSPAKIFENMETKVETSKRHIFDRELDNLIGTKVYFEWKYDQYYRIKTDRKSTRLNSSH